MAEASTSLLGLDIGAYDQIIALSQDNINETLQYHYENHKELMNFEVVLDLPMKNAIRGKISAPTIELIDTANADRAFYCLNFTEGFYTAWASQVPEPDAPVNPDAPPVSTNYVQIKIPLKGWKLAFYVDFAMKKMAIVPEAIKSLITIPGSYGVDQLLIDFGTADTMSFKWERSVVTGFSNKNNKGSVQTAIEMIVSTWLDNIKSAAGNHNTLGYAVKVDPAKKTDPLPEATFRPTAVRLQTINFRPEGKEDKISPSNGRNAFLFTEVTGDEGPPSTRLEGMRELAWSGDFFYDSLGGTMVMSRRIFWDKFLKVKLRSVNKAAIHALNDVASKVATEELATHGKWWLSDSDTVGEGDWTSTLGLNEKYYWHSTKHFKVDHEVPGLNHMYEYWTDSTVTHTLRPEIGTGRIHLDYDINFKTTMTVGLYGIPQDNAHFKAGTECAYSGTTSITLSAVDRTGGLSVTATDSASEPTIKVVADFGGIAGAILKVIPGIERDLKNQAGLTQFKMGIENGLKGAVIQVAATAGEVESALSGQNRLVFPGAGKFDMKSPIFSNKGDLLIGLSYRLGASA